MRNVYWRALLWDRAGANLLSGGGTTEHLNEADGRPTEVRLNSEEGGL